MACCYLVELFTNLIFSKHENKNIFRDTRFYYLSLKRKNNNDNWSINGLYPQYSNNSYPRYCKNIPFNYTTLKPIIGELNNIWYSDTIDDDDDDDEYEKIDTINKTNKSIQIDSDNYRNEEFWEHEWLKHGTCMFNNCDEMHYFKKALMLYIEVIQSNVIDNYKEKKCDTEVKIPFDINFKLLPPNLKY